MHRCGLWSVRLPFFFLLLSALPAVGQLQDPRPESWVLDEASVLSPETEAKINDLAGRLRADGRGELAVVVLSSINGRDPRTFATNLFNTWGLGDSTRHDGLLIFAALEDRAAEIILGQGIDSSHHQGAAERVMQDHMVPNFRNGNPAGALLSGAEASAFEILGLRAGAARPAPEAPERRRAAPPVRRTVVPSPSPASSPTSTGDAVLAGGCLLAIFAAGAALLGAVVLLVRWLSRRRERRCPGCQTLMTLLDEAADDAHLTPSELAEERVDSVGYEVWCCLACNHAEKVRDDKWLTTYKTCPRCHAKTLSITSDTVTHPTEFSEGLVQVREQCAHCGHSAATSQVVPHLVPVQSRPRTSTLFGSGSGVSGGSSSRSSGSSSSRSSSRSSSSGGGRSSGRGASGRW